MMRGNVKGVKVIRDFVPIGLKSGLELCKIIGSTKELPESFNASIDESKEVTVNTSSNILKCPKCGSTAVTTGARGYKLITGFLGSSKTVNRCGKCGHSWKPRR